MKKQKLLFLFLLSLSCLAEAQVVSCASFLKARQKSDVVVPFRYTDIGTPTPIEWGLDVAWISEDNLRVGTFFAGKDLIDVVRVSYRPTESVEDGVLSDSQKDYAKTRADLVKTWLKSDVKVNINSDPDGPDSWYNSGLVSSTERGKRWAKCIDLHYDYLRELGLTDIVSISPFNEPDYGWNQGYSSSTRKADMKAVCKSLREDYNGKYDNVRLCGGNTLNDDYAYEWWYYLKDYLDEGNTHQLAGTFANYADFFTTVSNYGHHATADELHNTMEAMVGVEYGMQTGIWWGTCERTRSQFMKATWQGNPGSRLGYAEHRDNWTSASVYRLPDGQVQGFGGTSERQAVSTNYCFVALDRPVWYGGERGRDYVMELPGGTAYQTGQTNAETVVDIESSADVMPHIDGTYKIVNVNSGLVMGFNSVPSSGTSLTQKKNNNNYKFLQWKVYPMDKSGDFAYYIFELNTGTDMVMDILNWNYNDGADVVVYPGSKGGNEQFYLEYAGNGAFYIRSRLNAMCVEVAGSKTTTAANIQMGTFTGAANQQWRFVATNVTPDAVAPNAPTQLKASPKNCSIDLSWEGSTSNDVKEYVVVRNGYVLAKGVTGTSFTDNEAEPDSVYAYSVYAIDKSMNYSERSNTTDKVQVTNEQGEVLHYTFDDSFLDETPNGNHFALYGDTAYITSSGHDALKLSGTDNFLQLPYTVANHKEISISCWVYYRGGNQWQRVFDFGNGTNQYMFLTTNGGSGPRFAIKNGGDEQYIEAGSSIVSNKWHHLVVTLAEGRARLYVDGKLKGSSDNFTISPADFRPALNYIGHSQFSSDPDLKAYLDEFVIYNYELTPEEVTALTDGLESVEMSPKTSTNAYDLTGRRATRERGIVIRDGKKIWR